MKWKYSSKLPVPQIYNLGIVAYISKCMHLWLWGEYFKWKYWLISSTLTGSTQHWDNAEVIFDAKSDLLNPSKKFSNA